MTALAVGATALATTSAAPVVTARSGAIAVVASSDTGTNVFHPTFRRAGLTAHPSTYLPGFPANTPAAKLLLGDDFAEDVEASIDGLEAFTSGFAWVPGTNIVGGWSYPGDEGPVFSAEEGHLHGAASSSQIVGEGFGLAPDALLVAMDWDVENGADEYWQAHAAAMHWAADQPWIDIVHTNLQIIGRSGAEWFDEIAEATARVVAAGKLVVAANGNTYVFTSEVAPYTIPGVLAVGANDNCGYAGWSNPNPHVVADGYGTVAAAGDSYGTVDHLGTSTASPRVAGYVARLLIDVRTAVGHDGPMRDGLLVIADADRVPAAGPLADGSLTAAELHEVVRKTANPQPHVSDFDGSEGSGEWPCVPTTGLEPIELYAKMGYGEVSEHTLDAALDVLLGRSAMPDRPTADAAYAVSEAIRPYPWG